MRLGQQKRSLLVVSNELQRFGRASRSKFRWLFGSSSSGQSGHKPHPPFIHHYFSWGSWCWSLFKLKLRLKLHITWPLRNKQPSKDSFKPADSLRVPSLFDWLLVSLDCECKLLCQEGTCTSTGKVHSKRLQCWNQTCNIPAVRLQFKPHIILHLTFEITVNDSDEKSSESFPRRKSAAALASHKPARVCSLHTVMGDSSPST